MWVAMAIEFTGLLHSSYLIRQAVNMCAGAESNSKEGPRSEGENLFYWASCLVSLAILSMCGVVTMHALLLLRHNTGALSCMHSSHMSIPVSRESYLPCFTCY